MSARLFIALLGTTTGFPGRHAWDPATASAFVVLSNSNRTVTLGVAGSGFYNNIRSLDGHSTGKWYFEWAYAAVANNVQMGLSKSGLAQPSPLTTGTTAAGIGLMGTGGDVYAYNSGNVGAISPSIAANGKGAVDLDNGLVWWAKQGSANWNNNNGNPVTGLNGYPISVVGVPLFLASTTFDNGDTITINTGQAAFNDAVPFGFAPGW